MANDSLFINIAHILWAVNITPAQDEMGHPIIPDISKLSKPSLSV